MSYHTNIVIYTGHPDGPVTICDMGSITSNVNIMYCRALIYSYPGGGRYNATGAPDPKPGLIGLSGLDCSFVAPILREAVSFMRTHEEEMLKLEPSNGWGSYRDALSYLSSIATECEFHPLATLAISW